MTDLVQKADIVIIGAGPVGLFAVFQAGMLNMSSIIIDSQEAIGGQCISLYPEKPIYDIPACPKILAHQLIEKLEEQIEPFKPNFLLNQKVSTLQKTDNGFILETSAGKVIEAKSVLIAAGAGAFGPNKPPLENLAAYENKSVFYMVKQKQLFAEKKIVISGGGDSAVDWAISLAEIADVSLVHRRANFRCAPKSHELINKLVAQKKLKLFVPYQLKSINGFEGMLREVVLIDFEQNELSVPADYLLSFYGLAMDIGPIANWGLEISKKHLVVNPATMETNIPGVYAIGDIANYPGKLKLILTGFSEAAVAAHAIFSRVYPDEILHFEHSTSKGINF